MQQQRPQPDPWADFFGVYLDLGYALHGEIQRDPSLTESAQQLEEFLQKVREGDPHSEWHRGIVYEVIKRFRGKSKDILFQEPSYFEEELKLFPGIDGIDIAKLWRERPLYRNGLWQWVEQLFVIGNVCLHPNRKHKFLKVVRQLKQMKQGITEAPEEEEEDISGVVQGMAEMFGMGDNPAMGELMTDLAKHMHQTMSTSENPMGLLQSMISGDMGCLGDLEQRMQQKIAHKMETGELTEADFERQREGMLQNFGGMEGLMQMANGLGLEVPNGEGENGELTYGQREQLALQQREIVMRQAQELAQQQQQPPNHPPNHPPRSRNPKTSSKTKKRKKKSSRK
jgi:hypothetical protein